MFVRRLKHKNGRTYVQVVQKISGKYKVAKSFGASQSGPELEALVEKASLWIKREMGTAELDFDNEASLYRNVLERITSHKLVGIDLVLGKIFDQIGFGQVRDELFRDLVLYRLVYPKSKLKTTEYLYRYQQKSYSQDDIYRYMDKLYDGKKELVQQIAYDYTQRVLGGKPSVVFYDVTTLYFDIDNGDGLRKTGFSKEGKHQNPQILLGLLVGREGYPLAYDIFPGNKFEGHTMLPVLDAFKVRYDLGQLVVVADSGLLSKKNIADLQAGGYEFILGARIKNESASVKAWIQSLSLGNGQSETLQKDGTRLIVAYSEKRAAKDRHNRERGLKKLQERIRSGKLTKANINNRGYNKYLELQGEVKVAIDKEKFEADAKWDGIKGYITNSILDKEQILENYGQLWKIEKAFRVAKTDLKIRPIFHRRQKRIEAHICLTFAAYMVYKELERQLKEKKSDMSPNKVIEIIQNIYQIEMTTPKTKEKIRKTILLSEEQRAISRLFHFGC